MDPVNPVRLSRLYEDVDWVERPCGARRGDKKQDEYRPSKRSRKRAEDDAPGPDTFKHSEPQE